MEGEEQAGPAEEEDAGVGKICARVSAGAGGAGGTGRDGRLAFSRPSS